MTRATSSFCFGWISAARKVKRTSTLNHKPTASFHAPFCSDFGRRVRGRIAQACFSDQVASTTIFAFQSPGSQEAREMSNEDVQFLGSVAILAGVLQWLLVIFLMIRGIAFMKRQGERAERIAYALERMLSTATPKSA